MKKFGNFLLAFAPLVLIVGGILGMVASFVAIASSVSNNSTGGIGWAIAFMWIGIIAMVIGIILCFVTLGVFTVSMKNNERLEEKKRGWWLGLMAVLMFLVYPIYWWKYLR